MYNIYLGTLKDKDSDERHPNSKVSFDEDKNLDVELNDI